MDQRLRSQFIFFLVLCLLCIPNVVVAKYLQLDAVIGVKSRFSSGCSSIQELANLAQHRKIDVVLFSDNNRLSLEYGVDPLERIFRKKQESSSVLTSGAAPYLSEINSNDESFPETLLIPAIEAAPFYYWTGNIIDNNLVAHNWSKRLLLVGMDNPKVIEQIPSLNSNFSQKYLDTYLTQFLIWLGLFLLLAILYFKSKKRICFFFAVIFLLLAINDHPFQSSLFNQYEGDQGIAPYQELIDYASTNNALTFWVRPEGPDNPGIKESVGIETEPYARDLLQAKGFTGFEAVYDKAGEIAKPGKEWDQVLVQYIKGEREKPIWAYGGNDLVCEGEQGRRLGGVRTVLLVREKTREAALEAIAMGRMYSVAQQEDFRLSLDEFTLFDRVIGQEAEQGGVLFSTDAPIIKAKLRFSSGSHEAAVISIIREGKLVKRENATLPYQLNWRDATVKTTGMTYYRVIAEAGPENRLVSNPIFVNFSHTPMDVASLPSEERVFDDKIPDQIEEPASPIEPTIQEPELKNPDFPQIESLKTIEEQTELATKVGQPFEPKITTPESPNVEPPEILEKVDLTSVEKTSEIEAVKNDSMAGVKVNSEESKMPISSDDSQLVTALPTGNQVSQQKTDVELIQAKKVRQETDNVNVTITKSEPKPTNKTPSAPTLENRYVVSLIDGLTLKNGPSVKLPEMATAMKGERLLLVKKVDVFFNGKPWLEVKKGAQKYFVWGGLVKLE